MKLFFVKDSSAYTIFKTIEKIPKGKQVEIFIDSDHELLDDAWWGKQFKDYLEKGQIDATFVTKSEKCKDFFQNAGCKVKFQGRSRIGKALHLMYMFLFNIKKFHLHTLNSNQNNNKKYTFYLVVIFEVLFVFLILFLLYTLVLPTTYITLSQSQSTDTIIYNFRYYPYSDTNYPEYTRYISVPYYTGHLDYKYELGIDLSNIRHTQNPSKGKIKIINKIPKSYNFLKYTKFVTDDGLLFKSLSPISIPAAYENVPGETIITVEAMEKDKYGIIMGSRGNISEGTQLYVKNFNPSLLLKKMFAQSIESFSSEKENIDLFVSSGDIKILSGELHHYIEKNKLPLTKHVFNIHNSVLLNFDQATKYKIMDFGINNKVGDKTEKISGYITARLSFIYVKWDDLLKAFQTYLKQRPMKTNTLLSLDKNSFYIFDDIQSQENTYIIPTKIDIVKGYDFSKDSNGLITEMKDKIVGLSKSEARDIILRYPEVATANIKIRPFWYKIIPSIKSRIKIDT